MSVEVLEGIQNRDYYLGKIEAIKQDIKDNESGIRILYTKKSDLIKGWAKCEEELGTPLEEISRKIITGLIELDCKRGVKWAYEVLDSKYKRDYKRDLTGLGNEEEESKVGLPTFNSGTFLILPNEIISLETAPPEDIQENEEYLAHQEKEIKRRHQEYIDLMRRRHIGRIGQKESDVEGTPRPYDPVKGYFYQSMIGLAEDLQNASRTCSDISEKIEYYPPKSEEEDKRLAEGVNCWRSMFQWFNEHLRPYADLKFSQSYPDWWHTQLLNKWYGKHAAAVKSKIATLSGGFRGLTREQCGDKIPDLAEKALHFKGLLDMANRAFELMQKDFPEYHKDRVAPSIATRKENVGPKLSESAFGSSKDI